VRALYGRLTSRWLGQEAEELRSHRRLLGLAPALAATYALAMGVISWDFVMSLEPHWFSTLLGPYFFMGAFLGGIMATALMTLLYRDQLELEHWILPSTLHDLGKLGFGFTVFWGYLFFSQYIVIWYGLLPIEQAFVIHRFTPPFKYVAQLVGLGIFVIPFFGLLSVVTKRTPRLLATLAIISLAGLYLERYLLVFPSWYIGADRLPLSWPEPAIALLFAGLLLAALGWFASRFPLMQMWQPPSELELQGVELEMAQEVATPRE
jgi:Ni/Fe-hydrogenase subunit HybB-like protein